MKTPWPDWCEWCPNQLWCWDGSQFENCELAKYAYAIVDLVSRKWIATHLTANPDSVAARVLFARGLDNEDLLTDHLRDRLAEPDSALPDDDAAVPLLLAISDNGTEMRAHDTRRFMALCSIAQHFGRPSTPTDQAWIETLWGHVKREHPHLMTITDPVVLAAELERIRAHHNGVRLHEAIGYVTPNDEYHGRRRHHPRRPPRWHAHRRRATPGLAPAPTMNPTTTLTNNNLPATLRCGLNPSPIYREESETPHIRRDRRMATPRRQQISDQLIRKDVPIEGSTTAKRASVSSRRSIGRRSNKRSEYDAASATTVGRLGSPQRPRTRGDQPDQREVRPCHARCRQVAVRKFDQAWSDQWSPVDWRACPSPSTRPRRTYRG